MQEKGTIDLYLSRPVSRTRLLLSRYVAGLILAGLNVVYLIGSVWIVIIFKTGVVHPRFLLGGTIIFFAIATLMAFAFLIGVATSSSAVSIMATYSIFFISAILSQHEKIEAAIATQWRADLVHALYWILPKTAELARSVIAFVAGDGLAHAPEMASASVFLSTGGFAVGSLLFAVWLFRRKEF
jgi:ABC-type transport system involved in multi-copper enzyme maturation permease subunit